MKRVSQYAFRSLNSYFMLLVKFLFRVQIIELENMLTQIENELKTMKEEAAASKKKTRKKEETKRPKEITKDMVTRWKKDGGQDSCKHAHPKM
jgi:hypothetical protein